ncbi:MAG: hypothetical protein WCK55_15255 [Verrucomicrobiota bacterium]
MSGDYRHLPCPSIGSALGKIPVAGWAFREAFHPRQQSLPLRNLQRVEVIVGRLACLSQTW